MSGIFTPALESASGATAELYDWIKKAVGRVPNTYAAIGARDAAVLVGKKSRDPSDTSTSGGIGQ